MDAIPAILTGLRLENSDLVSLTMAVRCMKCIVCITVFISPETAQSKEWRSLFCELKGRIATVAVDEAHCIPEWLINFK